MFANLRSAGFPQYFANMCRFEKDNLRSNSKNLQQYQTNNKKSLKLERSLIYVKMMKHFSAAICTDLWRIADLYRAKQDQ